MMIGEIGGPQEAEAALFVKENMKKPVIGYVAGPHGAQGPPHGPRRRDHLARSATPRPRRPRSCASLGLTVVPSPAELGQHRGAGAGRHVEARRRSARERPARSWW